MENFIKDWVHLVKWNRAHIYCERREHSSQSYGTPKKRNKILNIGRIKRILYKTFFYYFSILN